jgi:fructose-bisphosphate aldolase class II
MIDKVLEKRIDKVKECLEAKLGSSNKLCLLSTKQLLGTKQNPVLFGERIIIPAFNPRIIPGILDGILDAAEALNAVIGLELARSEAGSKQRPGYTGLYPELFANIVFEKLQERNYTLPWFLNGDHITVLNTSEEEYQIAKTIIDEELNAGYTSFAIDASHNSMEDNIKITESLAKYVLNHDNNYGLELEVGEILKTYEEERLTTKEEALYFTKSMKEKGIDFQLLAIYNGAFHGLPEPGKEISIDVKRTKEIGKAIEKYSVLIAQHGVSGTSYYMLQMLAKERVIGKGNIATIFQDAALRCMQPELAKAMQEKAKEKGKEVKSVIKDFREAIASQDKRYIENMRQEARRIALEHIVAFGAKDSANLVFSRLK